MLPIYSAKLLKSWDQFTIEHKGITSIDLMEKAAIQFVCWFISKYQTEHPIIIFCGNGNNGGDGLAIARMLSLKSYKVKLVLISVTDKNSEDYESNLNKLEFHNIDILDSKIKVLDSIKQSPNLLLIDAIFGYGLNREVHSDLLQWFQLINESDLVVHSIDLPSGMFVDKLTHSLCIHANYTFTFQNPKLCHLIPESGRWCGNLVFGNIDLDPQFIIQNPSKLNYLEQKDILLLYKPRNPFDWKNKYGHILTIGGNKGMAGAIILAASASLRSGCGLCSIYSEECNREIIQISLPEALYVQEDKIDFSKYSSLVIGPGMGMELKYQDKLKEILISYNKPMVLDADALNIIAFSTWHSHLTNYCILTPHVGEFDRLFGASSDGFERLDKAINVCSAFGIHIILKGKYTAIISPDKKVFFNSTGNPGLAKGGSGDVLSGMVGSFLAQGYSKLDACLMAVYFHGLAADIAKEQIAQESIFPSDIVQHISDVFISIAK